MNLNSLVSKCLIGRLKLQQFHMWIMLSSLNGLFILIERVNVMNDHLKSTQNILRL